MSTEVIVKISTITFYFSTDKENVLVKVKLPYMNSFSFSNLFDENIASDRFGVLCMWEIVKDMYD